MLLPTKIITYLELLLSASYKFTATNLSELSSSQMSHDLITRTLKLTFNWKVVLVHFLKIVDLNSGYLIFDETDVDKSYANAIQGLSWLFSHKKNKHIFGYHIVVICWTNNKLTIPLAWKIYNKASGKTKLDLALELIIYTTYFLGIKPKAYLFDSLYASEEILSFLNNHNLTFFSQLAKNRLFNYSQLRTINKGRPYWDMIGEIKGHIKVYVVKNRRKYYVTNNLCISREKLLDTYKIRWRIEEVFRFVKSALGFEKCQSTSIKVQHNTFGTCFVLYALLQIMSEKTQLTDYRIKRKATLNPIYAKSLDFKGYFYDA